MTCIITLIIHSVADVGTSTHTLYNKKILADKVTPQTSFDIMQNHCSDQFLVLMRYKRSPHLCVLVPRLHKSLLSFTLSYASFSPFYFRFFIEFFITFENKMKKNDEKNVA